MLMESYEIQHNSVENYKSNHLLNKNTVTHYLPPAKVNAVAACRKSLRLQESAHR